MRQAYVKAVPNQEPSPRNHDNASKDSQTDKMIGPSPTTEAGPGRRKKKKMTQIVYDHSPTKIPSRVWSPWL